MSGAGIRIRDVSIAGHPQKPQPNDAKNKTCLEWLQSKSNSFNLIWATPDLLFLYFCLFNAAYLIQLMVNKIAFDWIRTANFCCRKQPLYQLCHNYCPGWLHHYLPKYCVKLRPKISAKSFVTFYCFLFFFIFLSFLGRIICNFQQKTFPVTWEDIDPMTIAQDHSTWTTHPLQWYLL